MKCCVKLHDIWRGEIKATYLQAVPAANPSSRPIAAGDNRMTYVTVDALVKLETFDKGRLYQIPPHLVRMVDEWEDDDE